MDKSLIDAFGGDWGQYGEVDPTTLQGKIKVVFADSAILVQVTRADGQIGIYNLKHTPQAVSTILWTPEQVANASDCNLVNVQANWPIVYDVFIQAGLASPLCMVGVIGTIAVETASTFAPVREAYYLATDAAREAWYADTTSHAPYSGGTKYHGRGFVQTTHIENYQAIKNETGGDVVTNPDLLLSNPRLSAIAMKIYWVSRNIKAICEQRDWEGVRRAVYGGSDLVGAARIAKVALLLNA